MYFYKNDIRLLDIVLIVEDEQEQEEKRKCDETEGY